MALVTSVDEQTIDLDINNGREPPAIKRQRTKAKGALWKKISEATNGSSTHRRLLVATKRTKACFSLRDFDHQVARKACATLDKPIASEGTAPLQCILHSISSSQPAEFQGHHPRGLPSGEGGIRTHGESPHTRFPVVPIRPLSHLSSNALPLA